MKLPRVSEILADVGLDPDFSHVPKPLLTKARIRGTFVHYAIEALAYGYFTPEDELVAQAGGVAPYLDGYRNFIKATGYAAHSSEVEVQHRLWRYRGHVDSVGLLNARRYVVDWKSGELDRVAVTIQLGAYFAAWNACAPSLVASGAIAVQLRDDGTFQVFEADVVKGAQVFLAAVTLYWAKREGIG